MVSGGGDSNAPIPRCAFFFPRHIMRQIQILKGYQHAGAADWPQWFTRSCVTTFMCRNTSHVSRKWGALQSVKLAIKALSLICFARLLGEYNLCFSWICTFPTGTSTVKLTECKAAQKKWKDKSANDSPLLAGEQWQRSGETPGSSV